MLDFWEILLIVLVGVIIFVYTISFLVKIKYVKTIKGIAEKIKQVKPNAIIKLFDREESYQIEFDEPKKKTIIKVIVSRLDYEFIITNSNKWTVNNNPQQWTRKSNPVFIKDVEHFLNITDNDFKLVKIVLIYPGCKRVIRYLNESDTVMVNPEDSVKGIHFIAYDDFDNFLKNQ